MKKKKFEIIITGEVKDVKDWETVTMSQTIKFLKMDIKNHAKDFSCKIKKIKIKSRFLKQQPKKDERGLL